MSETWDQSGERPRGTEWSDKIPSILDPPNAETVRTALSRGVVFGLHMIYYGGSGPRLVAFGDWGSFHSYVVDAKPGDRFLLWSIEAVGRSGLVLGLKRAGEPADATRISEALSRTTSYAASSGREGVIPEIFAIRVLNDRSVPECLLDDRDILDSLKTFLLAAETALGSWYVVRFSEIDPQNAKENAQHLLVDAKRSDDHGAVPIGGYY